MTSDFDSFSESTLGAFSQSTLGERGGVDLPYIQYGNPGIIGQLNQLVYNYTPCGSCSFDSLPGYYETRFDFSTQKSDSSLFLEKYDFDIVGSVSGERISVKKSQLYETGSSPCDPTDCYYTDGTYYALYGKYSNPVSCGSNGGLSIYVLSTSQLTGWRKFPTKPWDQINIEGPDVSGAISSFAYYDVSNTLVTTTAAHGMINGTQLEIAKSIDDPPVAGSYAGNWCISNVTSTSFTIPTAYTVDDGTSQWRLIL